MSSRTTAGIVGVFVTGLILLFVIGGGGADRPSTDLLGERVPAVQGQPLDLQRGIPSDSDPYDIDALRGQWVLVNFFATWCGPCIQEHPELVQLERWGSENGELSLVSLVFQDDPNDVAAFFRERDGGWPVLADSDVAVRFQIAQVPESFLVDPDGRVVGHFVSGIEAAEVLGVMGQTP